MSQVEIQTSYGKLSVSCSSQDFIDRITREFGWFERASCFDYKLSIKVYLENTQNTDITGYKKLFETKKSSVFQSKKFRKIKYVDGACVEFDYKSEEASIFAADFDRAMDLFIQIFHSRFGKNLEKYGLYRVHACSISYQNRKALIMMPIGGGKSTLMLEMLKNPNVKIISDDTPLIDSSLNLYPFPMRIGIKEIPKHLKDFESKISKLNRFQYGSKFVLDKSFISNEVDWQTGGRPILLLGMPGSESKISSVFKIQLFFYLLKEMVIGVGIPQIVELYLEWTMTDFLRLIKTGIGRLMTAIKMVIQLESCALVRGPEHSKNSELILKKLEN